MSFVTQSGKILEVLTESTVRKVHCARTYSLEMPCGSSRRDRGDWHGAIVRRSTMPTVASPQSSKPRVKQVAQEQPALLPHVAASVTESEIAARAFELYCARGCEDGHDLEDWLQAERELRQGRVQTMQES
jgi:hypothetical protein